MNNSFSTPMDSWRVGFDFAAYAGPDSSGAFVVRERSQRGTED